MQLKLLLICPGILEVGRRIWPIVSALYSYDKSPKSATRNQDAMGEINRSENEQFCKQGENNVVCMAQGE